MKKNKIIIMFFLSLVSRASFGQNVSGHVVDAVGRPLEMVNVVLLSSVDSMFIDGVSTDAEGRFTMDTHGKKGFIRCSSMGYKTSMFDIDGKDTLRIVLDEDTNILNEVLVKSDRPKIQMRGEGMVVTVAGSVLEKTNTIEQLLDRMPNVSAQNGKVEVFGRGTPEIYLNGRKVSGLSDIRYIKSDEVKDVEVITNPGARYSASVKSVIRITTKKPKGEGFGVDAAAYFSMNEEQRTNEWESLDLNYREKKFDVRCYSYLSYNHLPQTNGVDQLIENDGMKYRQTALARQEATQCEPYVYIRGNHLLNDSCSWGAEVIYDTYTKNSFKGSVEMSTLMNSILKENSITNIVASGKNTNVSSNVYFVGKFGNVGVDFNADYYWNKVKSDRDNQENNTDYESGASSTQDVLTKSDNRNSMAAAKLVLTAPLSGGQLSIGGEYSNTSRQTGYEGWPASIVSTVDDEAKEAMTSTFVDYARQFGKLGVQLGVRYEYVDFNYYEQGKLAQEQSRNYSNVFPSLSMTFPIGNTQMQLTYAHDIDRPSFGKLDGSVQYDNRYVYEAGNPFLLPTKTCNIGYGMAWRWLGCSLLYSHVSDDIVYLFSQYGDDRLVSLMKPGNLEGYDKMQASISLRPVFGAWHPELDISMMRQWLNSADYGRSLSNPVGTFSLNTTIDTKWLTATVGIFVQTEGNSSNEFMKSRWMTNISLYKGFCNGKLSAIIDANDIFGTGDSERVVYSGRLRTTRISQRSISLVSLTVRYRFNMSNSRYKGTGAGSKQKNRL